MAFIQEQNILREKEELNQRPTQTFRSFCCNPTVKGIIGITIFASAVPLLIYYLVFDLGSHPATEFHTCSVDKSYRIQCGREEADYNYCNKIKCCFDNETRLCFHYLPSKYYYKKSDAKEVYLASLKKTPLLTPIVEDISLSIIEEDESNLRIVLHRTDLNIKSRTLGNDTQYSLNLTHDPLALEIYRKSTKDVIFSNTKGPTIVSEDYWEWTFQLSDEYLFGFGESLIDLDVNSTLTRVVYSNKFDHSTQPVFMGYKNGSFHGLVVDNKGPLEVTVLSSNLVVLKTIVGDYIELRVSLGPTVKDVMKQQGRNIEDVDSSVLGVHVCRGGSTTDLSKMLEEFQKFEATVNYETDCFHENLHVGMLNSVDVALQNQVFEEIKDKTNDCGQFWLSLPPQIPMYQELYNSTDPAIFYKKNNRVYSGSYLNLEAAYPDFNNAKITDFTIKLLEIYKNQNCQPKYLSLTDNWPAEDSYDMKNISNQFTYLSEEMVEAMSYTLPWDSLDSNATKHIFQHNNYGQSQLDVVMNSAGSDVIVVTASHTSESTHPVIIQNLDISWENFEKSMKTLLYNSIFGNHLTSVPICGSTKNFNPTSDEILCIRWYLMAATSPIFRISSDQPARNPESLETARARQQALKAMSLRKSLGVYFRTTLGDAEPIMRPMFYDFPRDTDGFGLVNQYMVGGKILVAHPVLPKSFSLKVYLPESVDVWYEFGGGLAYGGGWVTMSIVETDWVAFVAGGKIVPILEDTTDAIENIKLLVALDLNGIASGTLRINPEIILEINASGNNISITGSPDYENYVKFTDPKIYGL